MSATKAIRTKCLDCCLGSKNEVKLCASERICALHPLRLGKPVEGMSRLKVIREYCLGCGEGTSKAVNECEFTDCPLYAYRLGKNPNRKLKLTDEQRKDRANRLREATTKRTPAKRYLAEQTQEAIASAAYAKEST